MSQLLDARGGALKLVKVNGRATAEDVSFGEVALVDNRGNDVADDLAVQDVARSSNSFG